MNSVSSCFIYDMRVKCNSARLVLCDVTLISLIRKKIELSAVFIKDVC